MNTNSSPRTGPRTEVRTDVRTGPLADGAALGPAPGPRKHLTLLRRPIHQRSPPHFPDGRPHFLKAPRPRRVNLTTARLPE